MRRVGLGLVTISLGAMGLAIPLAHAQSPHFTPPSTNITRMHLPADQAAVWAVIDREWGRSGCCGRENLMKGSRYLDLLSNDAKVWFWGAPHPIGKDTIRMLDQANSANKPFIPKRIAYQLYPQDLIIHDNVAVALYTCAVWVIDKNNAVKESQCRSTDVLVRNHPGAPWKFLTWDTGPLK